MRTKFIDLKTNTPMRAFLSDGSTIDLTVQKNTNRRHKNRVRILSPQVVKVVKLDEKTAQDVG